MGHHLVLVSWLALMGWQIAWHGLLEPPLGNRSWILVLLATAPLLALTRGVWLARERSYFWAMFLVMLYFLVAVTEAWSNAEQRFAAIVQLLLTLSFFGGLLVIWRAPR